MAAVNSTMVPLGTPAPDFTLMDTTTNRPVHMATYRGNAPMLVLFICNHCPYVVHIRGPLADLTTDAQHRGVAVLGISSNDPDDYPEDGPEKMATEAKAARYTFPYLFDADQSVAKKYRAACTPDFFLYDASGKLFYRGQFDATRPGRGSSATGADLWNAIEAVLAGKPAPAQQLPSIGCNIKWRTGNQPDYF